jgi:hypothetical protein
MFHCLQQQAHYNYAQLLLTLHGADKGQEGIRALATAGESLEVSETRRSLELL